MHKTLDIYCGDQIIGEVQIRVQGLYHRFTGQCRPHKDGICRLQAVYQDRTLGLGVCVPTGAYFGIDTCIPSKRLGQGTPRIQVAQALVQFIPIETGMRFEDLTKLPQAHIEIRDQTPGIALPDTSC